MDDGYRRGGTVLSDDDSVSREKTRSLYGSPSEWSFGNVKRRERDDMSSGIPTEGE